MLELLNWFTDISNLSINLFLVLLIVAFAPWEFILKKIDSFTDFLDSIHPHNRPDKDDYSSDTDELLSFTTEEFRIMKEYEHYQTMMANLQELKDMAEVNFEELVSSLQSISNLMNTVHPTERENEIDGTESSQMKEKGPDKPLVVTNGEKFEAITSDSDRITLTLNVDLYIRSLVGLEEDITGAYLYFTYQGELYGLKAHQFLPCKFNWDFLQDMVSPENAVLVQAEDKL